MADTKIKVRDVTVHPETGHLTYHVYAETTEGQHTWPGPVKLYGCDPQMLRDRFNGNLEEFEAWVKSQHAPFVGAHPAIQKAAMSRKGKEL